MKGAAIDESANTRALLYQVVAIAGAIAVVAAVYLDVLDAPFLWDDHALLEQHCIRSLCSATEYFKLPFWDLSIRTPGTGFLYRPLTTLSLALDNELYAKNAAGFHATNLLLHLLNLVLVALLAVRLGAHRLTAVVFSLLWALLPRLGESVAWISGRTDMLYTGAAISCLLVWKPDSGIRRVIAVALGLLAALAKEGGLAVLAGLVIAEYLSANKFRRVQRIVLPASALGAYLCLRYAVLRNSGELPTIPLSISQRALTVFEAIGRYVWMSVDLWHPTSQIGVVSEPRMGFVALGLTSIVALILIPFRFRLKFGAFAAATVTTAAIPLLLVIHLVAMPWVAVVGDRLAYLPWAIACCGLAVLVSRCQTRGYWLWRWAPILPGIVVVTLIPRVRSREHLFADEIDFWTDAVATTAPSNWGPSISLSGLYFRSGWPQRSLHILESLDHRCPPPVPMLELSTKAKSLWRMGQYRYALDLLVGMNQSPTPEILLMRARLKLSLYDVEGAESDCANTLHVYGQYSDALLFQNTLERAKQVSSEIARVDIGLKKDWLKSQYDMLSGRLVESEREWLELLPKQDLPTPTAEEGLAFICEFGSASGVKEALSRYRRRSDLKTELAMGCEERLRFSARLDSLWPRIVGLLEQKNSTWGHCHNYAPFSNE
jgi:hypothetical protein